MIGSKTITGSRSNVWYLILKSLSVFYCQSVVMPYLHIFIEEISLYLLQLENKQ